MAVTNFQMEQIKEIAKHVFSTLGAGFTEKIYHNAMEVILKKKNIIFKSEHKIHVLFEGSVIGEVRADLVLDNLIIELKSVKSIRNDHSTQCGMYMKLLKIADGIVINFPSTDEEDVEFQELKYIPPCDRCGRYGHINKKCYATTHISGTLLKGEVTTKTCFKCGREGHYSRDCYASRHVTGYEL